MPFNPSLYLEHPRVASAQPLAWSDLKFNPLGLYSLRQRLGLLSDQRGIFTRYQQSFLASDIAWFAAGASEDKKHHVHPNTFHSLFGVSRENTPTGVPRVSKSGYGPVFCHFWPRPRPVENFYCTTNTAIGKKTGLKPVSASLAH